MQNNWQPLKLETAPSPIFMKKSTLAVLPLLVLLLTACSAYVTTGTGETASQKLGNGKAQELSEDFLLGLAEGVENVESYLYETLQGDTDSLQNIVDQTHFHDPQDIFVSSVGHSKNSQSSAIGTFTCEGSDHESDFNLTWMYNESTEGWDLVGLNIEEC